MGHTWQSQLSVLLLVGTCLFAWWKGSAAERGGALFILGTNIAADIAMVITAPNFPGTFVFAGDLTLAVALLVLAIRYSSMWLGAAMLLQSAGLGLHGMQLIGDGFSNLIYITAIAVMSNLMLLCIVAGTVASWRARLRGGAPRNDRSARLATPQPAG